MWKADAIVLGCTELPLILNNENCSLPCLDSVAIHIKKLVELAQEWDEMKHISKM